MSIAYSLRRDGLLRRVVSLVLTLVACGLAMISAYFLRPGIEGQFQAQAGLGLLGGVIALGGAMWLAHGKDSLQTLIPADNPLSPGSTRWWMLGLGTVLLALVAA